MKKAIISALLVILSVVFCACGGFTSYRDTNGDDDYTLQNITENDILNGIGSTSISAVSSRKGNTGKYEVGIFSGVEQLEKFLPGAYEITVSLKTESGNLRLLLCTSDKILYDFQPNGEDQTYVLDTRADTVYFKIAGEKAKFKLEYKITNKLS